MAESEHLSSEIKQLSDVYRNSTVRPDSRNRDNPVIYVFLCSIQTTQIYDVHLKCTSIGR